MVLERKLFGNEMYSRILGNEWYSKVKATHFLMIVKDTETPEWPWRDHVPIRQYIPLLRIDHEARRFAGAGDVGVERMRLREIDGHHVPHHLFDSGLPLGGVVRSRRHWQQWLILLIVFHRLGILKRRLVGDDRGCSFGLLELFRRSLCRLDGAFLALVARATVLDHGEASWGLMGEVGPSSVEMF